MAREYSVYTNQAIRRSVSSLTFSEQETRDLRSQVGGRPDERRRAVECADGLVAHVSSDWQKRSPMSAMAWNSSGAGATTSSPRTCASH